MGTIDQPKPSEPRSPQADQRPLQPGQTDAGLNKQETPSRVNLQTPESANQDWLERDEQERRK